MKNYKMNFYQTYLNLLSIGKKDFTYTTTKLKILKLDLEEIIQEIGYQKKSIGELKHKKKI